MTDNNEKTYKAKKGLIFLIQKTPLKSGNSIIVNKSETTLRELTFKFLNQKRISSKDIQTQMTI